MSAVDVRECGCKWEQVPDQDPLPAGVVPGSRRRRTGICEKHQREDRITSDAWGAADDVVDRCRYEGAERALFLRTVSEQLDAEVDA